MLRAGKAASASIVYCASRRRCASGEDMIPTPRPGDLPEAPEKAGPPGRGAEPLPLLLQSLEEIEELKKTVKGLTGKLKELERRVQALESEKI